MRRFTVLGAILLAMTATDSAVAATVTAPVVADASVESQNPTTNFGSGLLRVDGDPQRWALLQYQVPALSGTVTAAKLRVYKRVGSPSQTVQVQTSPCTWTYNTVTWNTRPTLGAVIATATHPAGEGWVEFNLPTTSVAQGTLCFALTKAASADVWITADDMDAANPSQLVITTQDAPVNYCDSSAVTGAWTGVGPTITLSAPQNIQAAVDSAAPGSTVLLNDGDYGKQSVTINKAIRLKAAHRFGARLWGTAPLVAGDASTGTAIALHGSGMMVDGLDVRYYETGVDADNAGPFTVQNMWLQSMSSAGIQIFDARQPLVQCNIVLDPYLANDPVSTAPNVSPNIGNAQSDYGVNFYGATDPVAKYNYFGGIFNQTLSFKEGNRNPTAIYNTFEGSWLTGLFFGQNGPHNGPYDYSGLPNGPDFGTLTAHHNVFREVYDFRGATRVVYYLRSPIRVWHVNGTTNLSDNVVESSQHGLGIVPECDLSVSDPGCAQGTVNLTHNTVSGMVQDGAKPYPVAVACELATDSWSASNQIPVSMTNQTCVNASPVVSGNGAFMFTQTGTRTLTTPIPSLRRMTPTLADPDLSYQP